jgi:hypothetical protein
MGDRQPPDLALVALTLERASASVGPDAAAELANVLTRAWAWAEQFDQHQGQAAGSLLLYIAGRHRLSGGDHRTANLLSRLAEACVVGYLGELEVERALIDHPGLRT